MKLIVVFSPARKGLNAAYLRFFPSRRAEFHYQYAKIFRQSRITRGGGAWKVEFAGKHILMPLDSKHL